ncbi:hypothetical protein PENSPDRAFT_751049 [Peniophora sp. CONT]|nr:hypothetical protein PENSPDRAFT_751049 [Peniophora sp. CONT]
MSSKIAAVFSKKNSSSTTVNTLSNDSMLTLVNEKAASNNTQQPRTKPLEAFGALAGTYGYGGILAGPPPVNPSGSKKAEKARKAAGKTSRDEHAATASAAASAPGAFESLAGAYGFCGALPGPPPVNPSGSSSKKARR